MICCKKQSLASCCARLLFLSRLQCYAYMSRFTPPPPVRESQIWRFTTVKALPAATHDRYLSLFTAYDKVIYCLFHCAAGVIWRCSPRVVARSQHSPHQPARTTAIGLSTILGSLSLSNSLFPTPLSSNYTLPHLLQQPTAALLCTKTFFA